MKIKPKNNLCPHNHFTEQLVVTFRKSPRDSNLNHESSSLLIQRLKNDTETTCNNQKSHTKKINPGAPPSGSSTAAETEPNWASIETGRSRNEICTRGI
jgi:hypothetical protein